MLPHVVLHVEASLDGRIDHIRPDVGRFYSLAAGFHEDAILTGADTLLRAPSCRRRTTQSRRCRRRSAATARCSW